MEKRIEGRIVKATGGFYYVQPAAGGEILECRARGIFRKEGVSPLVGDLVEALDAGDGTGTVDKIRPRKNCTVRPPLANLDHMVVVVSILDPPPNLQVLDKFLALLEQEEIEPMLAVTKTDLADPAWLEEIYRMAGYPVHRICSRTGAGVEALEEVLRGTVSAFAGNSGVGKSSLLNAMNPEFGIQVGDTSKKLGRGRHTTRHVELFRLGNGALVADTPGFSSITLSEAGNLGKEDLAFCFREFRPRLGKCRFVDCAHLVERDCAVLQAVESGEIDHRRHESYRQFYDEIKDQKPWEKK